jgi:DNA-binding PadR family transcriptional regulator
MTSSRDPSELLPLKQDVLLILIAVAPGPKHGYAIMTDVLERSGGTLRLQTGALYRTLKQLLRQDLIAECPAPPETAVDDSRRRYYRTTRFGEQVLAAESDRLAQLVRAARFGLAGKTARLA